MIKKITFLLLWISLTVAVLYFLQLNNSQALTRVFLPVNFISIVVALIHGTLIATLVGFFAPLAGFLATGFPQIDFLVLMILEPVIIGLLTCFLYAKVKKLYLTIAIDFVLAKMVVAVTAYLFRVDMKIQTDILLGLVGLSLQMIFIPMIQKILVKSFKIEKQKGGI
ncbi:hypothetical protein [Thermotoga profunda]|uniref:hypothetical protein n=1 Tax=Thermotoga profunda TaxID=1508420 RepID=UPI0005970632|nr:hypothetical protein [Thermotoga profunda]